MTNVVIVVPLDVRDPSRRRAWSIVRPHLRQIAPVIGIPLGQRRGAARRIATARNLGARLAVGGPDRADVLVFNDADSIVSREQLLEAGRLAGEAPGLVFAFDNYQRLSSSATAAVTTAEEALEAPVAWEMYGSLSSGCVAIHADSFEQLDGYDTDYKHGYEDLDFAVRAAALWPTRRVAGDLVHLWHSRPDLEPEDSADDLRRYRQVCSSHGAVV